MVDKILHILNFIPETVWMVLAAAGLISVVLELLKKWFSLQSDKVITFMLMALSGITSSIDFLMQTAPQNPTILAVHSFLLMGASTPVYRYLIKPSVNILRDAKAERERQAAQLRSDAEVNSVSTTTHVFDA